MISASETPWDGPGLFQAGPDSDRIEVPGQYSVLRLAVKHFAQGLVHFFDDGRFVWGGVLQSLVQTFSGPIQVVLGQGLLRQTPIDLGQILP